MKPGGFGTDGSGSGFAQAVEQREQDDGQHGADDGGYDDARFDVRLGPSQQQAADENKYRVVKMEKQKSQKAARERMFNVEPRANRRSHKTNDRLGNPV
jgi:hypothetical protein